MVGLNKPVSCRRGHASPWLLNQPGPAGPHRPLEPRQPPAPAPPHTPRTAVLSRGDEPQHRINRRATYDASQVRNAAKSIFFLISCFLTRPPFKVGHRHQLAALPPLRPPQRRGRAGRSRVIPFCSPAAGAAAPG